MRNPTTSSRMASAASFRCGIPLGLAGGFRPRLPPEASARGFRRRLPPEASAGDHPTIALGFTRGFRYVIPLPNPATGSNLPDDPRHPLRDSTGSAMCQPMVPLRNVMGSAMGQPMVPLRDPMGNAT
jgi:hypothetical protein